MTLASLLTQEQVERTHAVALEILENVGLLVRNEKARAIFGKHGCKVDSESQNVKLPRASTIPTRNISATASMVAEPQMPLAFPSFQFSSPMIL